MTVAILVVPSVTKLPPEADGAVVVGGSHAAVYAAHLVAKAGARAAIYHDAGIGFDEAASPVSPSPRSSAWRWPPSTRRAHASARPRT